MSVAQNAEIPLLGIQESQNFWKHVHWETLSRIFIATLFKINKKKWISTKMSITRRDKWITECSHRCTPREWKIQELLLYASPWMISEYKVLRKKQITEEFILYGSTYMWLKNNMLFRNLYIERGGKSIKRKRGS